MPVLQGAYRDTNVNKIEIPQSALNIEDKNSSNYATADGRRSYRKQYLNYLKDNPFSPDVFSRLIDHISQLALEDSDEDVLYRGYF